MKRLLIVAALLCAAPAFAAEPAKDRAAFVIEAIQTQRGRAYDEAASCYADANVMIAKLQAEIAELKAPKKADTPKPDAPAAQ